MMYKALHQLAGDLRRLLDAGIQEAQFNLDDIKGLKACLRRFLCTEKPVNTMLGPDGNLNLERFFVIRPQSEWHLNDGALLHRWMGESAGAHNHPWDFMTLVLQGFKHEEYFDRAGKQIGSKSWEPGSVHRTFHDDIHLVHGRPEVVTLVVTGNVKRQYTEVFENGMVYDLHDYRKVKGSFYAK